MTRCYQSAGHWLTSFLAIAIAHAAPPPRAEAGPRIALEEFSVEPTVLKLGDAFTIRAKAVATDVPLGSFLLRTAEERPKKETIPGFSLYTNGKRYMAEEGKYYLLDNGSIDEDPRDGAFAVSVNTKGWKEGVTRFAFFASRRPSQGPFVAARHDFAVAVRGDQVLIEDLGGSNLNASRAIQSFHVEPPIAKPGEPVRISAEISYPSSQEIRITDPFYIDRDDTLPGFSYNPEKKKSVLETNLDKATGNVSVDLTTEGWRPGVHHFLFELVGISGNAIDQRSFAIKIPDPRDRLNVTVEESCEFAPGTHFGRFLKLRDGTLFCEDKVSLDQGRT